MENIYLASIAHFFEKLPMTLAAITIMYFLWMMVKTESLYILKNRVLELFSGKRDFSDPKLQAIIRQHAELHHFNWHLSLNIKSTRQMYRVIAWAKHHKLDLEALAKARPYLDVNTLKVNLWSRLTRNILISIFYVYCSVSLLAACCLLISPGIPLKVNKTGTWLLAHQEKAHGIVFDWKLDKGRCLLDLTPAPLESAWDKQVICKLILNESPDYFARARRDLNKTAFSIIISTAVFGMFMIFIVGKVAHAESILISVSRRPERRNKGRLP